MSTAGEHVALLQAYNTALMATEAVYAGEYIDTVPEAIERGKHHGQCVVEELLCARRFIADYCQGMLDYEASARSS